MDAVAIKTQSIAFERRWANDIIMGILAERSLQIHWAHTRAVSKIVEFSHSFPIQYQQFLDLTEARKKLW
jgi:hypothetical protein